MINSIVRGVAILNLFHEHKALSLKEISELAGLKKTTAHSIVLTLLAQRFLRQNKRTRKYSLGAALFELGSLYRQRIDAFGICLPLMRELSQRTGFTAQLSVLIERDVMYLSRVVTSEFRGFSSSDGVRVAAHCTSSGKAMLATLSDERLTELFPEEALPRRTPGSIATRTKLFEEVAKIRGQGYATDCQEAEIGLAGVAIGFQAEQPMAISVPLTAQAMEDGRVAGVIAPLVETGAEIARQIGGAAGVPVSPASGATPCCPGRFP